ncbi:haloalkane dehalogenase [Roseibium sediminicola]|uniref:Haloalkane dehalogenase n=1 Tax=Roseibium sediminicola TaxID=2933272 RepID=A0ABT0GUX9_9HYPH|nr:haloalkane dehalogenase [Roseibium sp. CAU 1639]MCK7613239.1 haloalkane dehalogenase [Roseibium sp. CAU 1639]
MTDRPDLKTNRRGLLKGVVAGAAAAALTPTVSALAQTAASDTGTNAPYGVPISAEFPFAKKEAAVRGSTISYVDEGAGVPVVYLHGNPTSSYLWRNVLPHLPVGYRAIAPDLIGMGDSGKPDIDYSFADHAAYLDAFLDQLDLNNAILVVHDWGSALGMRYARLNPDRIAGLVFMEAIVPPAMPAPSYEAMPEPIADFFRLMHTDEGAELVLEKNFFVENVLPNLGVMRNMTEAEMDAYRRPFPTPASRKPVLAWPREVPIGGKPAGVVKEVADNGAWLLSSPIPKLMFYGEPGAIAPKPVVEYLSANVPNLEVRFVGAGTHFLQEEHPHVIGQGIADWLRRL